METSKPIAVFRLPERLNAKQARLFLEQLRPVLESDRPQLVFDLNQVTHLDAAGVDMLLECMSEVMKRDGDLKLGPLSPRAALVLEMTRTERLFEIYESAADAVRSFTRFTPQAMCYQPYGTTNTPATAGQQAATANLGDPGENAAA